jgi:hypothetical protein
LIVEANAEPRIGDFVTRLAVRLAGSQRDLLDDNYFSGTVNHKEKAIIADAPPKYAFPLCSLESLYVALEWIGRHLRKDAGDAFLNGRRETVEILLSIGAEPTGPIHV